MVAFPTFSRLSFMQGLGKKPAKVSNKPFSTVPSGTTGTKVYSGFFDEEYLAKLRDEKGIEAYDQMRRSDGVVSMLLRVSKNPIKSASWEVESADEDSDEENEIAEFVEHILFSDMVNSNGKRKTFSDFLSEALTCIEFGHSVFEKVHKVVKGHKRWGDYIGVADLGFRHQRSILEWHLRTDGSIEYIRQLAHGDLNSDVYIPGQHLLVFSIEKEGDNYQGISMLRPCYGAWFRKNIYRKLQAIGIERSSKGVPIGKIPEEMIGRPDYEEQRAAFQALIDKLSAHDMNGIVLGAGFDITQLTITFDSEKVQKAIDGEDWEMAASFVAMFLMLGAKGNSGSFALGTDLSAIFLGGIQHIGYGIAEKLNNELIPEIVKAKYGERDKYPELTVSGIADKAGKDLAEILSTLAEKGLIQVSSNMQRHVHERYDLPEVDEDMAAIEDERRKNPPTPPAGNDGSDGDKAQQDPATSKDKKKLHEGCNHAIRLSEDQRKKHPVSAYIEDRAAALTPVMRAGLTRRANDMVKRIASIMAQPGDESRKRKAALSVTMPDSPEYLAQIRVWASATIEKAKNDTLAELGVNRRGFRFDEISKLPADKREKIVQDILLTAGYQDDDFEKAVYFAFNESYGRNPDQLTVAAMENAVVRQAEKSVIETAATNMASKVVNTTRENVFFAPGVLDEVESFVFTNPDPISAICQSLVGRVFTPEEYEKTDNIPPLHHNCKSIIVAQTKGAPENLPVTPGGLEVTDPEILKTKTL